MGKIARAELKEFVERRIPEFHERRLESLAKLKLRQILKRKNPYLFRAKNLATAGDLVRALLDAYLSSQEETLFGEFLEQLARFVCERAYRGSKSSAEGIDLEFARDRTRYIVSVKSGPNWGNSRQIAKMRDDFKRAKRILGTNRSATNVVAVNGCCYGQEASEDKGDYLKVCGQSFWSLISGDDDLYIEIVEPIGHQARERNERFAAEAAGVENRFVGEFIANFCEPDGQIAWPILVKFNSGRAVREPRPARR